MFGRSPNTVLIWQSAAIVTRHVLVADDDTSLDSQSFSGQRIRQLLQIVEAGQPQLQPVGTPAAAAARDPGAMANRVYDEATLREAAAVAAAATQIQMHAALPAYQILPSALSQAALLHAQVTGPMRLMSSPAYYTTMPPLGLVPSLPGSSPASFTGMQPLQQRRLSTDSLYSEAGGSPAAPSTAAAPAAKLTRQERATETFRRGCLRLKALQVLGTCYACMQTAQVYRAS